MSFAYFRQFTDEDFSNILTQLKCDARTYAIVENWLSYHGFPGAVHGLNFPNDFQR